MRGISLFNRRLISRQYCILVWVTEQEMPKDLNRRDYESNERIVSGRERISHIFFSADFGVYCSLDTHGECSLE